MAKADRAFANMLKLAINEAHSEHGTRLRALADALVTKAMTGDVAALKEVADRIDGKVPQALIGDDESDAINLVHRIENVLVRPANPAR